MEFMCYQISRSVNYWPELNSLQAIFPDQEDLCVKVTTAEMYVLQ